MTPDALDPCRPRVGGEGGEGQTALVQRIMTNVCMSGRALCLECRVSWVRVPPGKSDCLGCAVLLCLACLFDLACFFLSSFSSLIKTCVFVCVCVCGMK